MWNWIKKSFRTITYQQVKGKGLVLADTSSGVVVSPETAITLSTLWRAARVISESVGCMPLKLYQRLPDGRQEAQTHPYYNLLQDSPNPEQSRFDFWSLMLWRATIHGHAVAVINYFGSGEVAELIPVHPDKVTFQNNTWKIDNEPYDSSDLVIVRGPSPDGSTGYKLTQVARESLGLMMGCDRFVSKSFNNNMRLGGTIEVPGQLSDPARNNLKESWKREHAGVENTGKWALLEEGAEANPFKVNFEEGQVTEYRELIQYEVCRWTGVPPNLLGLYQRATYANSEDMTRSFLQTCLNPRLVQIEGELQKKVIRDPKYYAEFTREAVIQMDTLTQHKVWEIGRKNGFYQVADIRKWLNLSPIPEPEIINTPAPSEANVTP